MNDFWINVDWVLGHLVEGENPYREGEGFDNPKGQSGRPQLNGRIEQADTNRDKDQQEKFPDIPVQTQFIRSLNEGDGTDKGGPDSLGLDSFTNKLKKGVDWHEEEPFKLPSSDVAAAKHPEIVKENQVNGPPYRCDAIDKEHLPVVEASNFLDISKENVEENQIDNLLHQGGEEADKEVHSKGHLGHHEDLDIIEIEADVFFHFNLQK